LAESDQRLCDEHRIAPLRVNQSVAGQRRFAGALLAKKPLTVPSRDIPRFAAVHFGLAQIHGAGPAGPLAELDLYIGYWEAYEVHGTAKTLLDAVLSRRDKAQIPGSELHPPRRK
jgi:hypothetical protein